MFSFFSAYDDEGYILQSVRSYLGGHRLFEDVFTQYGPGFYVLESLIHRTLRVPLTHDAERLLTAGIWVAASALSATTVLRLTRSWTVAAFAFVGVFAQLTLLVNEPGHPQGPLVLTIALVTLLAAWSDADAPSRGVITAVGVLTAFALLVKVNVGVYIALGFAIPLLLSTRLPPSRASSGLVSVVTTVACLLPLVVARSHLQGWALAYALVTSISLASTVVVLASRRRDTLPLRVIVGYTIASGVACALLLLPALVRGTSLSALLHGTIVRPSGFAELFQIPLRLPATSVVEAAIALAMSAGLAVALKGGYRPAPLAVAAAKILSSAAGLYLWTSGYFSLLAYFTPLLWVAAVPLERDASRGRMLGRGVLVLMAVFQSFQAYPVAGSQVAFATFLMIPAAALCAHDGITILDRHFGRSWAWPARLSFLAAALAVCLPFADPRAWRAAYEANYELRLHGAARVRLPAADVARFQWLSATAATNCGALLTLPGLYSLNAWSRVAPLDGPHVTAWTRLLSNDEQQSVWRAADRANRPCAVFSPTLAATWLVGEPVEELPAYREMKARFREVAESGGYHLLMREGDVPPSGAVLGLVAGRKTFGRGLSPIPILASFAAEPDTSTLRTWIRSTRTGVVLGCQSLPHKLQSSHWLPLLYVGHTGRLYGQHWTAEMKAHASDRAVNDGSWHHVALVKAPNRQELYVDGALAASSSTNAVSVGLSSCQAGTGITSLWPDGARGWMPFSGEIDGLVVSLRAWTAPEIAEDWRRSRPVD